MSDMQQTLPVTITNPGYKTSEFWVTAIISVVTLLNKSGLLGSIQLPTEAIASLAAMVSAYSLSRGWAKR